MNYKKMPTTPSKKTKIRPTSTTDDDDVRQWGSAISTPTKSILSTFTERFEIIER